MSKYRDKQVKREHDVVARAKPELVAGKANPRGTQGHAKRLRKAEAQLKWRIADFDRMGSKPGYRRPGSMQTIC